MRCEHSRTVNKVASYTTLQVDEDALLILHPEEAEMTCVCVCVCVTVDHNKQLQTNYINRSCYVVLWFTDNVSSIVNCWVNNNLLSDFSRVT